MLSSICGHRSTPHSSTCHSLSGLFLHAALDRVENDAETWRVLSQDESGLPHAPTVITQMHMNAGECAYVGIMGWVMGSTPPQNLRLTQVLGSGHVDTLALTVFGARGAEQTVPVLTNAMHCMS